MGGVGLCESLGLGPEDPLADVCSVAVTVGCPIAMNFIAKGVHADPEQICAAFNLCGTTGQRCGKLADGACADSTGDCKSGRSHYTTGCIMLHRCGCLPDGSCVADSDDCCSGTSHFWEGRCGVLRRCGKSAGEADVAMIAV